MLNMVNMQNMVNIHDHTWLFHRYVCTIKAHTDYSTGLSKGKQTTKQSVFVLRIAVEASYLALMELALPATRPPLVSLSQSLFTARRFFTRVRGQRWGQQGSRIFIVNIHGFLWSPASPAWNTENIYQIYQIYRVYQIYTFICQWHIYVKYITSVQYVQYVEHAKYV